MSPVRKNTLYFYQIVGLIVLVVVLIAGGGLGIVWMRSQIEDTARNTVRVQREIAETNRKLQYLDNKIAEVHSPDYLVRRATELGLAMQPPKPPQVLRMRPMAPQPAAETNPAETRDPFIQSFDLAVMEPVRSALPDPAAVGAPSASKGGGKPASKAGKPANGKPSKPAPRSP